MNWTELLIAIVSHTSWPITIVLLAWMFRDSLRSLLGRIESANSKYLKVTLRSHELSEKLSRAEGIADALELPSAPDSKRKPKSEPEEGLKRATSLVAKEPGAAMFAAWDVLVDLTGTMIEKKTGKRPASDQIIPEAAKFFDQGIVRLMASMLMIVEQQKSNPSAVMDKDFVFRFIKLTSRVILSTERWQSASGANVSDAPASAGPTIVGGTK